MAAKLEAMKLISKEEGIRQAQERMTSKGVIPKEFTEEELPQYQPQPQQEQSLFSRIRAGFWRLLGY